MCAAIHWTAYCTGKTLTVLLLLLPHRQIGHVLLAAPVPYPDAFTVISKTKNQSQDENKAKAGAHGADAARY